MRNGGVKNDYGCIAHRYVLYGLDNHGHFTVAGLSSIIASRNLKLAPSLTCA
jgi:hypothetical protein